jgi:hypothetical protein
VAGFSVDRRASRTSVGYFADCGQAIEIEYADPRRYRRRGVIIAAPGDIKASAGRIRVNIIEAAEIAGFRSVKDFVGTGLLCQSDGRRDGNCRY